MEVLHICEVPEDYITCRTSTKAPVAMSSSMAGEFVFTFRISECYPKHVDDLFLVNLSVNYNNNVKLHVAQMISRYI